mmetsp:Transcript_765/g.1241  ORF Transcript_765/g.1241 Transcript_765/m.1241 type:complete len:304 (-) Transcript_765:70-981(-)|eukprot:CAMPEP_0119016080 /NCGR_PEP_ID=MMETSP1176-20130426/11804_1 /TAXON_ID=265551 /ORGANISM="Synedropsis recta cf, Strain CCMP1620" /LENGTH=303 /DNA_ID=CAMNT_0006969407 /DNA_START=96 /DNA_END=1007 /DNA_ORIENTATION=-
MKIIISLFLSAVTTMGSAFVPSTGARTSRTTSLFGIAEWQDLTAPSEVDAMTKPVNILPFPSKDILLQGQTRYLQFVEEEHTDLFGHALEENEGIFGMGLLMHDGNVLSTMPLLEIEDYMRGGKDLGIFCKVRAVGRATVLEVTDESTMSAICTEHYDTDDQDVNAYDGEWNLYDDANDLADSIESLIAEMSVIETIRAGLDDDRTSRLSRYQQAYETALASDLQGYVSSSSTTGSPSSFQQERSWKELAAVSWAAYSTSDAPEVDASFRLNAMNLSSITERLEFAAHWLADVRQEVEQSISQ